MEQILKKLRLKYTLTTTLIAGIILAVLLGGLFGLLYASADVLATRALDAAIKVENIRNDDTQGRRCFSFYVVDGTAFYFDIYKNDVAYYGDDALIIVNKAMSVSNGKFTVADMSFTVESRSDSHGRIIYAVYDRTADKHLLVNTGMILGCLYVAALLCIAFIAYILSSRTLSPVSESFKKQRDLIANASHELKTPLTVIAANVSVMESEPDSTVEDNKKWLESIDAQIGRMNGLIKNMLELSKMENSAVNMELLDFSAIVKGVCLEFDPVCYEHGARLLTEIHEGARVMGDRAALERLVAILLDNAVKYCGEKGKIGLKLTADKRIRLSVMNTGDSISDEDAKHVFDRFYRSDGARQNADGNSYGLGLAIAQSTVIAHGGKIGCRGIEGKGSVFEVMLPAVRNERPRKNENKISENKSAGE